MKIAVIGGTGLIGSKLLNKLSQLDVEVVSATRSSGVNALTGEGLDEAMKGVDVVVDVSNPPSFDEKTVTDFFQQVTLNLLESEIFNDVKHHVALSVVGAERLPESAYMRAKLVQEDLVKTSGLPYTILRSTQFFELAGRIANAATTGGQVHVSQAAVQPIAADDVVNALVDIVMAGPLNTVTEIAGPVCMPMYELIRYYLNETEDPRQLVDDEHAPYLGAELKFDSLVAAADARLGEIQYEAWFRNQLVER